MVVLTPPEQQVLALVGPSTVVDLTVVDWGRLRSLCFLFRSYLLGLCRLLFRVVDIPSSSSPSVEVVDGWRPLVVHFDVLSSTSHFRVMRVVKGHVSGTAAACHPVVSRNFQDRSKLGSPKLDLTQWRDIYQSYISAGSGMEAQLGPPQGFLRRCYQLLHGLQTLS